jgi:hypothetical protein
MQSLKNHPFAVAAHFQSSIVFTFAIKKEELQGMLPPCLTLDTYLDTWAFLAIAIVDTSHLRPLHFPKFFGHDFILIGYRIFVRYTTKEGKRLRGLYILKSETNKKIMALMGNVFTHYQYNTTDIHIKHNVEKTQPTLSDEVFIKEKISIKSQASKFGTTILLKNDVPLPVGSPFISWAEARRFAGPLPFTFTYLEKTNEVLIIEGVRESWKPIPVEVLSYDFAFLNSLPINPILANAFIIRNVPYQWKKGKIEKWI